MKSSYFRAYFLAFFGLILSAPNAVADSNELWSADSILPHLYGRVWYQFNGTIFNRSGDGIMGARNRITTNQYVVCFGKASRNSAERTLRSVLGVSNFYPLSLIFSTEVACFQSYIDRQEDFLKISSVYQLIIPLSFPMKIHFSVLQHCRNFSASKSAHLSVYRGIGVGNIGVSDGNTEDIISSLTSMWSSRDENTNLVELIKLARTYSIDGSIEQLWSEAELLLRSAPDELLNDVCSLSNSIEIIQTSYGFRVERIKSLRHPACVLGISLLALLSCPDCTLIAAETPSAPMLGHVKALTQTADPNLVNFPYTEAGLDGSGQVVGIGDTGIDELSCFFNQGDGSIISRSTTGSPYTDLTRRKIVQYVSYMDGSESVSGHGTHVSGIAAGNDCTSEGYSVYDGVAPAAKIAFFDMTPSTDSFIHYPPNAIRDYFEVLASSGARIFSNSWGAIGDSYNDFAQQADSFLYNNPQYLIVFAAGNQGSSGVESVMVPGISKNVITVGSTGNYDEHSPNDIAYFSGLGPTSDGRIKPDVVAPGYPVRSAKAAASGRTCSTVDMSGTSMSTPAVAGTGLLIRQYFMEERFWSAHCSAYGGLNCSAFAPSGVLLKALLIASGEPVGTYNPGSAETEVPLTLLGAPPNSFEGYGRIALSNILPLNGSTAPGFQLFVQDLLPIADGDSFYYKVRVTRSDIKLIVSVAWFDPPAAIAASKKLLNNIGLLKYVVMITF
jgi:hypothetical protein